MFLKTVNFKFSDKAFIKSLLSFIGKKSTLRILDVCCGTGKYSCYFFNYGHSVTGIDISDAAIKKAKALQPQINWICEDVITYDYPQDKFDLIFMSGPSFYNDENIDANLPIMDKINQLIKPNGYFEFVKTTSLTKQGKHTKVGLRGVGASVLLVFCILSLTVKKCRNVNF